MDQGYDSSENDICLGYLYIGTESSILSYHLESYKLSLDQTKEYCLVFA